MALKDSFINLNKALRTTLQNVPAVVDTLIRGFDEIGDAADKQTVYSETERVIGKWVDGSDLYEKTIKIDALPNATTGTYTHGITNIDKIIYAGGISLRGTTAFPIPYAGTSYINIYAGALSVLITTATNRSEETGYVTLRYTKSDANRAPENDTRNGGDNKPDIKTVDDAVEPVEELKK